MEARRACDAGLLQHIVRRVSRKGFAGRPYNLLFSHNFKMSIYHPETFHFCGQPPMRNNYTYPEHTPKWQSALSAEYCGKL